MAKDFAAELARWGPDSAYEPVSLRDARAYCRRLALSHYENFSVASMFVPRRLLQHFHNVYAYCRWADDLADETAGGPEAIRLLEWWRSELRSCYSGRPRHPVLVALRETIAKFEIPAEPFLDLLHAFEQDQIQKSYETYADLLDYCRNSANPVGRLVLYVGECHDAERGQLSDHICTALQLTNFLQDVARDYEKGRIYIPRDDCARFNYPSISFRRTTPEFRALMRFQVDRTRELFQCGVPLIKVMPRDLRIQIELFIRGGLAILRKIERQDYDVWSRRPKLSKLEKAVLIAKVVGRRWREGATA